MAKNAKNAPANVAAANADPLAKYPTDAQMRADGMDSLSARIRHLAGLGVSTGDITRIVKRSNGEAPRYQHVRNVLKQPLKSAQPTENANN
jgi:hypothetical protein